MIVTPETTPTLKKKIDKLNTLEFDGLESFRIGSYLAISYYEVINKGDSFHISKWKTISKLIIKSFIDEYKYAFNSALKDKIVLFFSHNHADRKDYIQLMEDVHTKIDDSVCLTGLRTKKHLAIRKESFQNLFFLRKWKKKISKIEEDPLVQVLLLEKVSMGYRWMKYLERNHKHIKEIKGLITIFDAREYENIFAQYCKTKDIKTSTLEHGFFPAPYYIDSANYYLGMPYLGFVSDEFWAWGEVERNNAIIGGLTELQAVSVGYPKNIVKVEKRQSSNKKIGVILDGGSSSVDLNIRMLKVVLDFARISGFGVILKPHPRDATDYKEKIHSDEFGLLIEFNHEPIETFASYVEFAVCFNSSAYIDLLCLGVPIYRFYDSIRENAYYFLNDDDCFKNSEELIELSKTNDDINNQENRKRMVGNLELARKSYNDNAMRLFS